jgi:multidrug efflux pump subunit AcrA (membrane-fusion protein)
MLIQDVPDPAGDGYGGLDDGAGDDYGDDPPGQGNGFLLDTAGGWDGYASDPPPEGRYAQDRYAQDRYARDSYPKDRISGDRYPEDRYPESGYADYGDYRAGPSGFRDPGYQEPAHGGPGYPAEGYPDPGYSDTAYRGSRLSGPGLRDSGHPDPGRHDPGYAVSGHHPDSGHPGPGYTDPGYPAGPGDEGWYGAATDVFRLPPATGDDPWDEDDGYDADPQEEPARRTPLLAVLFPRRESRDRDEGGSRTFVSSAQRLGGILLAGASVVGVAFYVPSILAADSRSLTGVVSNSGLAGLNFGASGRVGRVLVHLGQAVHPGEVLATEAGGAQAAAVRADRAAITADKANLAALQADGAAAASIAAAQAQLAKDRARRAADRMRLAATEIVAPRSGTVVAIDGQPGDSVSPAGLSGPAAHAQASPGQQPRFSLLPSGPMASLRAAGLALPVIALRTGGGWQVRLLIPQTDTSAVKAGGKVTISVPAAQLSGVKGTIGEVSPTPVANSGGASYEAVVRVIGRTPVTPLSGMTANVQLGSLRRPGRAAPAHGG